MTFVKTQLVPKQPKIEMNKEFCTKIENTPKNGSSQVIIRIVSKQLKIYKLHLLTGDSDKELPIDHHAIVSIENIDHFCALSSILNGMFPAETNQNNTLDLNNTLLHWL